MRIECWVTAAFSLVLWPGLLGAQERAPEGLRSIELPFAITEAAIDGETGAVAVSGGSDKILVLPRIGAGDAGDAKELRQGGQVSCLRHKRLGNKSYFLYATQGGIGVIDAAKGELVKLVATVNVEQIVPVPDRASPLVYYTAMGKLWKLDLATLAAPAEAARYWQSVPLAMCSPNGDLFYVSKDSYTPGSLEIYDVPSSGQRIPLTPIRAEPTGERVVIDPLGEFVALGPSIRDARSLLPVATVGAPVDAFFAERPLIVGHRDRDLYVFSRNTIQQLVRVTLPPVAAVQPIPQPRAVRGTRRDPRAAQIPANFTLLDEKNAAVIVVRANTAVTVKLSRNDE